MKKILVSFVAIMAVASSAVAAETMNMHDQVNNAQAPAHQMQSSAEKSAVQGDSMTMMDMSGHDQAAMSHEMMQNGNASAHQAWRKCIKMMKGKSGATNETAKSFSEMNEHEKPLLCMRRRIMVSLPLFISSRLKSIAARSPRINPQLHL
jgi:translation elongation factor P/translation initiation factor 5A